MRLLLRFYRKAWLISLWLRRRFTFSGHVLLMLLVAAAAFGVNTKKSTCYQLFVLLLLVLIVAMIASRLNRVRVSLQRHLPRCATVGEVLCYRVKLNNLGQIKDNRLGLIEQFSANDQDLTALQHFYRHSGKRWFSYRDWLRFVYHQCGARLEEVAVPELANGDCTVQLSFTPTRRGTLHFTTSYLASPDVLGLFRRLWPLAEAQSVLVLPKRYVIRPLALDGQRKYQTGGVALASAVGNSTEFMSLRDYRRGDALNSIHWRSYAKHGRLIVKEHQDEYFVRRALILDTFVGDTEPQQFEAAVSVAASLAISEQQNEALLDLMFVGQEVHCFTSGRSLDHVPHMQEILANVQPSNAGAFSLLQQAVLARAGLCSSLICVLMCWDEARLQLVQALGKRGLAVAVFLLHDGSLTRQTCPHFPEQGYLLDFQHLERDLAKVGGVDRSLEKELG